MVHKFCFSSDLVSKNYSSIQVQCTSGLENHQFISIQGIDGSARKPALAQDIYYLFEKTYQIAPYLGPYMGPYMGPI